MENNRTPLVSVIMPAYNAERFLEDAIRSVMAQSVTDWELLVLDDGSTDATAAIAANLAQQDSRIRFLPNEVNMGVAKTRNRGFDLCRGQYVALLDSDDIWLPEKLEKQLALAQNTGADILYCSYGIMDEHGNPSRKDYVVKEYVDLKALLKENIIGCSTVMLSKKAVETYRFAEDFYHEDYVLWLQMLQDGCKAVGCREILVQWRLIANSRSFDKRRSAKKRWLIYRRYMHMPAWKSAWYFAGYAIAGLKKYLSSR